MATYKKRGNKPKSKQEREEAFEKKSTTAGVFRNLDEGASRTEAFVARNQRPIFIVLGVIVVGILGYLAYHRFVQQPTEKEASGEMAQSQAYFESALRATNQKQSDSLYDMALQGNGGKFGFLDIIDNYGSTKAANLSEYYAGMALLKTGKYKNAIDHLENFSSDDQILAPLAKGAIGDAFMQLDQPKEALGYYEKAASMRENSFTSPRFLMKAARTALKTGNASKAEKHLKKIKEKYPDSPEASQTSAYLGKAQAMQ